jgi:FkbM family methyltransferase
MFQHQGVWFPDGEQHLTDWMTRNGEIVDGKGTYQIKKLRAALEHCKRFRVAVDAGAHVGLWSLQLAKQFHTLRAFEPIESFRACWSENMKCPGCEGAGFLNMDPEHRHIRCKICDGDSKWVMHPCALGASTGSVVMQYETTDTGGTHVARSGASGEFGIEVRTLDSFGFTNVDFLKIDCEGYEHHVINGARETLLRCKPCVIVEQKQHIMQRNYGTAGTPAVDLLKEMGAEVRACLSGDYILSW